MNTNPNSPSVPIDTVTYKRFEHYAKVVGKPVQTVVNKALNRWMDDFGEDILSYAEMAQKKRARAEKRSSKRSGVVVVIPQSVTEPDYHVYASATFPMAAEAGGCA